MSGQCFPVKTDEQIAALLEAEAGNFITVLEMPVSHKPLHRLTRWHFLDGEALGIHNAALRKTAQGIFKGVPERKIAKILRGMPPHGGGAWWLLSRDTVSAVLRFLDGNPWYLRAFRWSFAPDEMFFQTIVATLGIRAERTSPTFSKWIEGESHPLSVDEAALWEARASWHLMARKFDAAIAPAGE